MKYYRINFKELIVQHANFEHPDFGKVSAFFFPNYWEKINFDETVVKEIKGKKKSK